MMKLILPEKTEHLYESDIPILTIQAIEKYVNGKSSYYINSKFLKVEDFVAELLIQNKYNCISGLDLRHAYEYINFSQLISEQFDRFLKNLENDKQFGKTIHGKKIQELKTLKSKLFECKTLVQEKSILNYEIVNLAQSLYLEFHLPFKNLEHKLLNIFQIIKERPSKEIITLMQFFDHINGLIRGTPDLFVYSQNEFYFVEVKSDKDSLSKWQISFIHFFRKMVGENIKVIHVVNDKW